MKTTVIERGRLVPTDAGDVGGTPSRREIPRPLYDRLLKEDERIESRFGSSLLSLRKGHALVGQWVGVVQVPGLVLEILPKISEVDAEQASRDSLLQMLRVGGIVSSRKAGQAHFRMSNWSMHDELIAQFLDELLDELGRGLDRGYVSNEENLQTFRGRLLVAEQVRRNPGLKHRFYCRFDTMENDTPILRRFKQALRLLGRQQLRGSLQAQLLACLAVLEEVPDSVYAPTASEPAFSRQNERFKHLFRFATLLLDQQAPTPRAGDTGCFSLLFDMDKVFEAYIAALLRKHQPRGNNWTLAVQGRGCSTPLFTYKQPAGAALTLKPDLVLARGDEKIVIDTKWKRTVDFVEDRALNKAQRSRAADKDLYQLYAYKNRFKAACAFLLYPEHRGAQNRELFDPELQEYAGGLHHVNLHWNKKTEAPAAVAAELMAFIEKTYDRLGPSRERPGQ
jgi:5-methylcytosine-specific restriction enzyme subunit McrC